MPSEPEGLRCPKCGYSLQALTERRCPECGEEFVITDREGYLAQHPTPLLRKLCNAAWGVGVVLIILSWINVVPWQVGWVGFGITVAGALPSYFLRR